MDERADCVTMYLRFGVTAHEGCLGETRRIPDQRQQNAKHAEGNDDRPDLCSCVTLAGSGCSRRQEPCHPTLAVTDYS
eukprot:scaffold834_cov244-Pinguiococcus_pyrenoidosus.AAC.28